MPTVARWLGASMLDLIRTTPPFTHHPQLGAHAPAEFDRVVPDFVHRVGSAETRASIEARLLEDRERLPESAGIWPGEDAATDRVGCRRMATRILRASGLFPRSPDRGKGSCCIEEPSAPIRHRGIRARGIVRLRTTLGAALLLAACGGGAEVPTPGREGVAPAASPTAPAAPTTPPARTASSADPPNPSPTAVAPGARATLRENLARGRAAARAGRHAEALASMQQALALSPSSARLRCETGFVAFRAGEVELAGRLVSEALHSFPSIAVVPEPLRVPLAMCQYNAGLVYVARRRTEEARAAFGASLVLRENAAVRRALTALQPATPAPLRPAFPLDDAALRERLVAEVCEDTSEFELPCRAAEADEESDGDTLLVSARVQPPSGTAPPRVDAELIVVRGDMHHGEVERYLLVLTAGGARQVGTLEESLNLGLDGQTSDVRVVRFEWLDLVAGDTPELVLELTANQNDEDLGLCARSGGNTTTLVLCDVGGETARCVALPTRDDAYYETDGDCEGGEGEATSERSGHAFSARFEGGQLVLTPARDGPRGGRAPFALRRPVSDWLADDAYRWPPP